MRVPCQVPLTLWLGFGWSLAGLQLRPGRLPHCGAYLCMYCSLAGTRPPCSKALVAAGPGG